MIFSFFEELLFSKEKVFSFSTLSTQKVQAFLMYLSRASRIKPFTVHVKYVNKKGTKTNVPQRNLDNNWAV